MNKREKKFETLDDIDRDIIKKRGRGHGKTSADKNKKTAGFDRFDLSDSLREHGRLLVIPAICILLIIIISLLGNKNNKNEAAPADNTETTAQSQTEAEPEISLKKCEIPEINMLITEYFDARLNADTDRLYTIFNKSLTQGKEEAKKELEAQRSWIQAFKDIQVYELPGLEKDARLLFITYNIDFRRTDTLAPGIMYCYAMKNADGEYIFAENLIKDQIDYVNEMLEREDVAELRRSINNSLSNALNGDSTLALIYTSFVNGEIYKEYDLDVDKEQEVDLFINPEDSDLVPEDYEAGEFMTENFEETTAAESSTIEETTAAESSTEE
ncbi:MAG: hypothetical protein Q4B86_05305 [Eubacteriales bacterium]|nr:hypothetical protein [Eubacteriales bacterium]